MLPRAEAGQPWSAPCGGGLFGFIGYGVYDLTNYATLTQYTLRMTVVDICRGVRPVRRVPGQPVGPKRELPSARSPSIRHADGRPALVSPNPRTA